MIVSLLVVNAPIHGSVSHRGSLWSYITFYCVWSVSSFVRFIGPMMLVVNCASWIIASFQIVCDKWSLFHDSMLIVRSASHPSFVGERTITFMVTCVVRSSLPLCIIGQWCVHESCFMIVRFMVSAHRKVDGHRSGIVDDYRCMWLSLPNRSLCLS